jgi:hypothetical protein
MRLRYTMSYRPKKVIALGRSLASHFALEAPVLERTKPLSREYLDAIQDEINANLGPASERKPVTPSGW